MYWANLLKANVRKEYIELKRYLPNTIAMVFTFYFIFLGMFTGIQLIGDPNMQEANIQYAIVNYIFWFLAMMVMNSVGWTITNEAMRGTLEQLYMSPMGVWRILATRLIATTVIYFFIIVGLLYLSMATTGQWLNIDVISIMPILILTLISMFGVGFMIAGISIHREASSSIFTNTAIYFSSSNVYSVNRRTIFCISSVCERCRSCPPSDDSRLHIKSVYSGGFFNSRI